MLVSDLAGRSNIVMKARELGFDLSNDTPQLRTMLATIKELEHKGYEFEAADGSLALLIQRALANTPSPFTVDAYHVSMRSEGRSEGRAEGRADCGSSVCEATVKSPRRRGTRAHGGRRRRSRERARRGAARRARQVYPHLRGVRLLTDYKVRIIDSTAGFLAATTAMLIQSSDGVTEWGTIGVNENIVEASLQALVDSLECALINSAAGA